MIRLALMYATPSESRGSSMTMVRRGRGWAHLHPRRAAIFSVAILVVLSTLLRIILSGGSPAPWIFVDELIYSELGRSAFTGFAIRGNPTSGYGPVYPYLIGPAYLLFDNLTLAYAAVKWTNALLMSLTAIPVYLAARMLMGRSWSLASAALAVLIPAMVYTNVVMTESAFYPAFALAFLLVIRSLRRPTVVSQLLVFAAAALCFEIRPQGIVIIPAFISSAVLVVVASAVWGGEGGRWLQTRNLILRLIPTWIVAFAGLLVVVNYQRLTGRTLSSAFGAYSITMDSGTDYAPKLILSWFVLHVAETSLWLGVLPFFAFLFLLGVAVTRTAGQEIRVFAAAALPQILMMTGLVSAFLIFSNVGRIEERNLFYMAPFFMVALCWWLSSVEWKRLPNWALPLLVASCALPLIIPYERFLNQSAVSDTFGLFVPWAISLRVVDPVLTVSVIFLGVVAAATVVVALRPHSPIAVLGLVVVFMGVSTAVVQRRTDRASNETRAGSIAGTRDWIDRTSLAANSVVAVYPGGMDPLRLWQNEFFNRAVGAVYTIGQPLPGALLETVVNLDSSGHVIDRSGHPVTARYALVDAFNTIAGRSVATDDAHRMRVVRVAQPMRIEQTLTGVFGDGWSGGSLVYTRYGCDGGTVNLTVKSSLVLRVGPVDVVPRIGDHDFAPISVPPDGKYVEIVVPLRAVDGVCQTQFAIPGTVIPQQVAGTADTRSLGVFVRSVTFVPN